MTIKQKNFLREWGPLLAMIVQLGAVVAWGARLDYRVAVVEFDSSKHIPRSEHEILVRQLQRVEDKLDRLIERN